VTFVKVLVLVNERLVGVVVLAMLGMLSPASRGALMTAGIFVFMFMGSVAACTYIRLFSCPVRFAWTSMCKSIAINACSYDATFLYQCRN